MPHIHMTETLARAAGTDRANRRMRKAGRGQWNAADYACAVREYYRLMEQISFEPSVPHCINSQLV